MLLEEFQDVISVGDDDLGRMELVYHKIDIGDAQPVRQSARRLPFHQKEEVRHLLDDMLSWDIVVYRARPFLVLVLYARGVGRV